MRLSEQQLQLLEARALGRAQALEGIKRPDSPAAAELARLLATLGGWQREYQFCRHRRWRFDYAQPELLLGVELEGGLYTMGRHVRPCGYAEDCIKYNNAQAEGWRVLRFTNEQVLDGTALATIVEHERLRLTKQ